MMTALPDHQITDQISYLIRTAHTIRLAKGLFENEEQAERILDQYRVVGWKIELIDYEGTMCYVLA